MSTREKSVFPFRVLLLLVWPGENSVPVDKVYAVLGIARSVLPNEFTIQLDTLIGGSAAEVYTRATTMLIENSPTLGIPSSVQIDDGRSAIQGTLPSWVPNFLSPRRGGGLDGNPTLDVTCVRSSNFMSPKVENRILTARGVFIGGITAFKTWKFYAYIAVQSL